MDFVKVMHTHKRMCEENMDCDYCPLHEFVCEPSECDTEEELEHFQKIVMQWGHEHPEYCTVKELLDYIKTEMGYAPTISYTDILDKHIPASLAQELGLVPIDTKYEKGEWTL